MAISPTPFVATGDVLTATNFNLLPRGVVAYNAKTADQTGIAVGTTDISSMSVSWTATSSRYYRTTIYLPSVRQLTSGSYHVTYITDGSGTVKSQGVVTLAAGDFCEETITTVETGLSGSITRKARIQVVAGTVDINATGNGGFHIVVEDIGGA